MPFNFASNDHDQLAAAMDFDHIVVVTARGHLLEAVGGGSAPDVLDPDNNATTISGYPEWALITAGLTGQHGYRGPWLHDSEILAGGVATRVFEHAAEHGGGYYVALYATYSCEECGGAGLVYKPFGPGDQDTEEVDCPKIATGECEPGGTIEGWAIAYKPLQPTTVERASA